MNGKIALLMAISILSPTGLSPHAIESIVTRLDSVECFHATVRYVVAMPQAHDEAAYTLTLESQLTDGTRSYLIDRHTPDATDSANGFTAGIGKRQYRFRNQRLHESDDTLREASVQFANLLPHVIASRLRHMASDPAYRMAVDTDGQGHTTVTADMNVDGQICYSGRYTLDNATGMPLTIEIVSNAGSISEHTTVADYTYENAERPCPPLTEERLAMLYSEAFGRFRKCDFTIDSLPESQLPGFSLPTPTGERYTYHVGDGFAAPTVLTLLKATDRSTPEMIASLRSAIDRMPINANLIFAFIDNRHDDIDAVCPSLRLGETTLMTARTLAGDCGATRFPAVIVCRTDGYVSNVFTGYEPDLATNVILTTTLAARRLPEL